MQKRDGIRLIPLALLVFLVTTCTLTAQDSDETAQGVVGLHSQFSYTMMDQVDNLRKADLLLDARQKDILSERSLYIGAAMTAIVDFQKSNADSKFGYLMRHPTSSNQIGKTVSEAVIHSAQLSLTSVINSWITAYAELLYNPEQSFGAGTLTGLDRNQVQLRKGFVLLGDLNSFPLYLAIGKMDVNFGQMGSVSPFTNSTMWHAFGALSYGAMIGYREGGLNASFTAVQGGAQFRAAHTPVDSTNVPSRLNNFAGDINYTVPLNGASTIKLGASYLHGTAYCQGWPVFHFMPCAENNPAYTFYATVALDKFTLKGSFAKTLKEWPGTFNPTPPLNEFEASKVSSLDIGAKYRINDTGNIIYCVSAEFSNFIAGPDGSPWERQNQIVAGLTGIINNSSKLFVEIFKTDGYAPLNFISGGNLDDPGQTHSLRDASSFGIVVGTTLTL